MKKSLNKLFLLFIVLSFISITAKAQKAELDQNQINGSTSQKQFTVAGVTTSGSRFLDTAIIKTIFGVSVGDKVMLPNDEKIAKGMKAIWSQGLLEDLKIDVTKVEDDRVWLNIEMKERPRFLYYSILGVNNTEKAEIKEKLDKNIGTIRILSEAMKSEIKHRVYLYFADKGFSKAEIKVYEEKSKDTKERNAVGLVIAVNKGKKIRINQINMVGNEEVSDYKLKSKMKDTKEKVRLSFYPAYRTSVYGNEPQSFNEYQKNDGFLYPTKTLEYLDPYFRYRAFTASKFDPKKYDGDKSKILEYYNAIGHRDARIVEDTVYDDINNNINIDLRLAEGKQYYFGDIVWSGNTKYSDSVLNMVLGIKKGDVYNRSLLEGKLGTAPNMDGSLDLGVLYLDQGYLNFRTDIQETSIVEDTINFRINSTEGGISTVKRIIIKGNDKTHDNVLRREITSLPGYKFNRSEIINSQRQLAQLGYIDPNTIQINPIVNPADNTVDIEYIIEEKSSDQIELQAGYGGGIGFTGTAGITLNNFSTKNMFKRSEWSPIPSGDGQTLSFRWQSNGFLFNSLNFSFTEPWLGGKKPVSLTFGAVYTRMSRTTFGTINWNDFDPNASYIQNYGANVMLSKRLKWPDNRFIGSIGINYQRYFLKNYKFIETIDFKDGTSNNLHLMLNLSRSSIDNPIFPRSGSNISFRAQLTPPYSLFNDKDYSTLSNAEKFKWIEYQKYRFDAEWYQRVYGDLILKVGGKFGYLSSYSNKVDVGPFERFQLGGDGMTGFQWFIARDVISQRGYDVYIQDGTIFNKYIAELRYPFSLNPQSTIFGLAFFEAGNAWVNPKDYNPFALNRSVGLGIRMRLPMFGLLGFDYGFGFDSYKPGQKLSSGFKFTFMLGREPD